MSDEKPRIEINWVQSTAGALAAVTSAVLLSTVGVAGTLIGAALGSLAATIGSAIYSYYIRVTRHRVAAAQEVAAARIGLAQARGRGAPSAEARDELDRAEGELEEADAYADRARQGWHVALAGLPWKRIALTSVGIFVVAMGLILTFELVTGRAVSAYTGGSDGDRRTSVPGLGGGAGQTDPREPSDDPADERTREPGDEPAEDSDEEELPVPTESPTAGETGEPTPSETPTPSPVETPPETVTETVQPSAPAPTAGTPTP